ncbi:MAG: Ig-like domain-containing protein [Desulfobacterales bacterium]|nr:Ig-like domain-containing protein [Desulfobacterales bacterium]
MRKLILFISLLIGTLSVLISESYALPSIKIVVKVLDESGAPISDTKIEATFYTGEQVTVNGKTDSNGIYIAKGEGLNFATISATKEGYYYSGKVYNFDANKVSHDQYQPFPKEITLVLTKVRNPVPMYAFDTDFIKIPEFGKPIGFDLEKRDWVVPYGKGVISDFIFTAERKYIDFNNGEISMILTFSNPKDGIINYNVPETNQSIYIWPFEAPLDGYLNKINKWVSSYEDKGFKSNLDKDKSNYIFRIRTQTDSKGNIISTKYGKIRGEIIPTTSGKICFTYYFNPDGTRNLEFDTKKNLFKFSYNDSEHNVNRP